jgi:phage replication O-like protein O
MANPQKELGHTSISNELFEAILRTPWTRAQYAVIFFIIRKTYGWGKKSDKISISQFARVLPYSKTTIIRTLKRLKTMNVAVQLKVGGGKKNASEWALNKNYEDWQTVSLGVTVTLQSSKLSHSSPQTVTRGLHTKETNTKETTKERILFFKKRKKEIMEADPSILDVKFDRDTGEAIKIY